MPSHIYEHNPSRIEAREWRLTHLDEDMHMLLDWIGHHVQDYTDTLKEGKSLKDYFIRLKKLGICCNPGDWIVKDGNDLYLYGAETFKKNYHRVPEGNSDITPIYHPVYTLRKALIYVQAQEHNPDTKVTGLAIITVAADNEVLIDRCTINSHQLIYGLNRALYALSHEDFEDD